MPALPTAMAARTIAILCSLGRFIAFLSCSALGVKNVASIRGTVFMVLLSVRDSVATATTVPGRQVRAQRRETPAAPVRPRSLEHAV
jgi:hypothetical protein